MKSVYLDNSATTKVDEKVASKVMEMMLTDYGNPSSLHSVGSTACNHIETARGQVASVISVNPSNIIFTSGGTESNNMAIMGGAKANAQVGNHIVTTTIEHSSVLRVVDELEKIGCDVTRVIPNNNSHLMKAEEIIAAVKENTAIVSFIHVNNEIGEILPVKDIVKGIRAKNPKTLIHCDCVQSFGKYEFNISKYDVDMISASAHKLHGPKGVGLLYAKDKSRIAPLNFGGKQEHGIKTGTENTPGICGFGEAAMISLLEYKNNLEHIQELKGRLLTYLKKYRNININSPIISVPHILNFSVIGKTSKEMVDYFSMKGIYVSAGSACKKGARSHVLVSAGHDRRVVESALRVSFSKYNTFEDVDRFIEVFEEFIEASA